MFSYWRRNFRMLIAPLLKMPLRLANILGWTPRTGDSINHIGLQVGRNWLFQRGQQGTKLPCRENNIKLVNSTNRLHFWLKPVRNLTSVLNKKVVWRASIILFHFALHFWFENLIKTISDQRIICRGGYWFASKIFFALVLSHCQQPLTLACSVKAAYSLSSSLPYHPH